MVIREIRLTVTVEESIQHHTLGNGVLLMTLGYWLCGQVFKGIIIFQGLIGKYF